MFNTLGNIYKNPNCGLLFLDFENGDVIQMNGRGKILFDQSTMPGAQRMIEFKITTIRHMKSCLPFEWKYLSTSPYSPEVSREYFIAMPFTPKGSNEFPSRFKL